MTKKDIKTIKEICIEERECGQILCDFDDRSHDLQEIAEAIGVEMVYDTDKNKWVFQTQKDETRTNEALEYYYKLHF